MWCGGCFDFCVRQTYSQTDIILFTAYLMSISPNILAHYKGLSLTFVGRDKVDDVLGAV